MSLFIVLYLQSISCALRHCLDRDDALYALPAGLIGSMGFIYFPNITVALYIMWKTLQVSLLFQQFTRSMNLFNRSPLNTLHSIQDIYIYIYIRYSPSPYPNHYYSSHDVTRDIGTATTVVVIIVWCRCGRIFLTGRRFS